jgi:hypothetical protein
MEDEIGETGGMYRGRREMHTELWLDNLKETCHFEGLDRWGEISTWIFREIR